jgi:elongation factor G
MGIQPLLDAVVRYLPSPLDVPPVEGHTSLTSDKRATRKASVDEPFCGLVFKITSDQHGDLYFTRIYSGKLDAGTRVLNSTRDKKEIVSRVWEMYAKQRIRRDEAFAGDIVAVVGCKHSLTGDTLCDSRDPIILERMEFPRGVISMSIEPRNSADKTKLQDALGVLRREDPTFTSRFDEETGQTIITGMGELHLEILHNKLRRDMGVDVKVGKPRVAYKETVCIAGEAEGRFVRQIGGRGQFGVVSLRVEPYKAAAGTPTVVFEVGKIGEAIPKQYLPSIEEGVRDAAQSGQLAGYPMENIKITLIGGEHHPVDSSEMAFLQAASMAFELAVIKAEPAFMEPIMLLQVVSPEEFLGAVTGDLNARRAEIINMSARHTNRVIDAHVPLAEMFGYSTVLRSLTQGRATSTLEPSHYAIVPKNVAEGLLRYV